MPAPNTPESKLVQLRMAWGAMAPLPLVFLVGGLVAKTPTNPAHVPLPALVIVGVAIFVLSMVLPPRAAKTRFARFPIPADATPEQKVLAAYNAAAVSLPAGIGPAVAISAVGVAALLFDSAGWLAAPFFLASFVALGLHFPTHAKVLALLDLKREANAQQSARNP
ncbi:MAG: hypothetical protein ABI461_18050 [Polyangiaceae bacterium]